MNHLTLAGLLAGALVLTVLAGCTGTHSFSMAARAGDTVSLAVGWHPDATRDSLGIRITDAAGSVTEYLPGDSRIRAVINQYPDPVSHFIVADVTGLDIRSGDHNYGTFAKGQTGGDNDLSLTTVFLDLPQSMALGVAKVKARIDGELFPSAGNIKVDIIGTGGVSNPLTIFEFGGSNIEKVQSLERAPNFTVVLSGATTPYAVELTLAHNPTASAGGSGAVHVANPRGDIKSIAWTDNGTNLKVLLTPAMSQRPPRQLKDFKFHVAGGVSGLQVTQVAAYDAEGVPAAGMKAGIAPRISSVINQSGEAWISGLDLCDACGTAGSDPEVWVRQGGVWQQSTVIFASKTFVRASPGVTSGDLVKVVTPFGESQWGF